MFGNVANKMIFTPNGKKDLQYIKNAYSKDFETSFGMFGSDYNQSVTGDKNNAIANPEDFLAFPFRHLTATIVGAGTWKATDFSDEKVLKSAAALLTHKPVMVNHEMETGNIVGVNGEIKFVAAKNGVPAGLEGPIWIDGKLHQDLTRKLTAFPVPHIQSVSVTVSYEWEPSHEFTNSDGEPDDWFFERRVGSMVDGKMVRRIVTKIVDFYETSFVWLGADPYAKILTAEGKPLNIEKSAVVKNSAFEKDPLTDYYKSDGMLFIDDVSLSKENIVNLKLNAKANFAKIGKKILNNQEKEIEMEFEKIAKAVALKLNKSVDELTPEMISGFNVVSKDELETFNAAVKNVGTLTTEKENLETKVSDLETVKTEFEKICKSEDLVELEKTIPLTNVVEISKYGKQILDIKRKKCIDSYKLSVKEGDKPSDAVIKTIENSDIPALDGFLKTYGETAFEQYGATCTKCESGEHISFRSTKAEGNEEEENESPSLGMADSFRF